MLLKIASQEFMTRVDHVTVAFLFSTDSWVGYITEKLYFSSMNNPIQWLGYKNSKFQAMGHLQSIVSTYVFLDLQTHKSEAFHTLVFCPWHSDWISYFSGQNTMNCGKASHCQKVYPLLWWTAASFKTSIQVSKKTVIIWVTFYLIWLLISGGTNPQQMVECLWYWR